MKKIVVVLALIALPQVMGLSTLCDARVYCSSDPTSGVCLDPGLMCGSYTGGKRCTSVPLAGALASAKKTTPPSGLTHTCTCQ